jgi:hypothetical protein
MTALRSVSSIRLAQPSLPVQQMFMKRMDELGDRSPCVTFHGTPDRNLASIQEHGFLRPGRAIPGVVGRSVPVAHGSSYGRGVYSSTTAQYSVGFCQGGSSMFVCAVLTGNKSDPSSVSGQRRANPGVPAVSSSSDLRVHGNIMVAFDERRIVPMFILDFNLAVENGSVAPAAARFARRGDMKQQRAQDRKDTRRGAGMLPRPLLRALLRAVHSRIQHEGRTLKQIQ